MKLDDMTVPGDIEAAVHRAAASVPAQAWDLDALKSRAGAGAGLLWRRRWNRKLTSIIAGAVAVAAAGSAAAVVAAGGGGETTPAGPPALQWVFATDPDHLYAVRADCAYGCAPALFGSDDGGVTWTRRMDRAGEEDPSFRAYPGSGGAILVEDAKAMSVSTDGGRTWKSVVDSGWPWPRLPDVAVLGCGRSASNCRLSAVDPATGRYSPFEQQPMPNVTRYFLLRGRIWLDGQDGITMYTASSSDGARTWRLEGRTCAAYCDLPLVPGLDGSIAYRVQATSTTGDIEIWRSDDSGVTWESFEVAGPPPGPARAPFYRASGIVAPDGGLIIARFTDAGAAPDTWLLPAHGGAPSPVRLGGLPDHIGRVVATGLTGNADTGYLLTPTEGDTLYRSVDAVTWWPLRVPAA